MRQTTKRSVGVWTAAAVLLAFAGWWLFSNSPSRIPKAIAPSATNASSPKLTPGLSTSQPVPTQDKIDQAVKSFVRGDEKASGLINVLKELASVSKPETSAAIRSVLNSKADGPTGQGFRIGAAGFLVEAPTLRTLLLDQLAQIDPAGAAAYARVVLNSMDSADEWAIALRDLARGDTSNDARDLLRQKTFELLANEDWQKNPTSGYLEAFDTAVYLGGTNFVPALADMLRLPDNKAVSHAAYLSLDRLVINNTGEVLEILLANPEGMKGHELTRADYFARTDLREPQQRRILENYLLDPARQTLELQHFAGVFPNANFMISQNLLTPAPEANGPGLIARDEEALRVVREWKSDPRFSRIAGDLETIESRLKQFTRKPTEK